MIKATNVRISQMKQFRMPRSRKRRIRKKWKKDKRNWREMEIKFAGKLFDSDTGVLTIPPQVNGDLTVKYAYEAGR